MTVAEFLSELQQGIEYHQSRGAEDDSAVVCRFWAPDDEFMGPRFRPKLLDERVDVLAEEHLYGVTLFQARLCMELLGVPRPPKLERWTG